MHATGEIVVKPDDIEGLATAIAKALQQSRSVSDSEHYDHHMWIKGQIDLDKRRIAFWEDMKRHVTKWGAISIISAMLYALYLAAKQEILKP